MLAPSRAVRHAPRRLVRNSLMTTRTVLIVLVAALGYFVDVFDLVLFSVVRTQSLKDLGVSGDGLLTEGVKLLNAQMFGMIVGGIIWGVLGDKVGRVQALFGSILTYALANIAPSISYMVLFSAERVALSRASSSFRGDMVGL